jgi:transposase
MKKEQIRREFFKLRIKGHSYSQCKKILLAQFSYEVTARTLQRWSERLNKSEWDLMDKSRRPKTINKKIDRDTEEKIISIRKQTGFGEKKLINYVDIGHTSINKILNKFGLTNPNKKKRKRIKYIRWQR